MDFTHEKVMRAKITYVCGHCYSDFPPQTNYEIFEYRDYFEVIQKIESLQKVWRHLIEVRLLDFVREK